MAPLNKMYIDDAIQNLPKICHTSDAFTTYKIASWKSIFMKKKDQSVHERLAAEKALREQLEK